MHVCMYSGRSCLSFRSRNWYSNQNESRKGRPFGPQSKYRSSSPDSIIGRHFARLADMTAALNDDSRIASHLAFRCVSSLSLSPVKAVIQL